MWARWHDLVDIDADYAVCQAVDAGQAARQTGRAVRCGVPLGRALKKQQR